MIDDDLDERKEWRRSCRLVMNFYRSVMDLGGSVSNLDVSVIDLDESEMMLKIGDGSKTAMDLGRLVRNLGG